MRSIRRVFCSATLALCLAGVCAPARAELVVSSKPTRDVSCTAGVCTATAPHSVLNVIELANMLGAAVTTLRSGPVAQDIVFDAPFVWASDHALVLDAYRTIHIRHSFMDAGPAPLTLTTNDGGAGGTLSFGKWGQISFLGAANRLTIDGNLYRLSRSIAELAANIAAHPKGFHALANKYDATQDRSFSHTPIPTVFKGTFDGLGNTISHVSIYATLDSNVGLFGAVEKSGMLRNVRVTDLNYLIENTFFQIVGGLVGYNAGTVLQCSATGQLRSDFNMTGGGLVGLSYGKVQKSFANVFVSGAVSAEVGGLIGNAHGTVSDSYAIGRVIAGDNSDVGGLVGYFIGKVIERTYSTGQVSGGHNASVGGLVGSNVGWASGGKVIKSYWDRSASGIAYGTGNGDATGIVSLDTQDLQAALPPAFDPVDWNMNANTNGGRPFLRANPQRVL